MQTCWKNLLIYKRDYLYIQNAQNIEVSLIIYGIYLH